jgi:hypothetical protein
MSSVAELFRRSEELVRRSRNIHEQFRALDAIMLNICARGLTVEAFANAIYESAETEVCRTVQSPVVRLGILSERGDSQETTPAATGKRSGDFPARPRLLLR